MSARASPDDEQTYYTFTLNTSSKDAEISGDVNYGADFRLDFGLNNYTGAIHRFLVQFDLPPALSGVNITSATLRLWGPWQWSGGSPSGEALRACMVTHDWVEGTGKSGAPTQDGVTWNEYNYSDGLTTATNNWDTPGGDYTLTDSSTLIIPPYPATWTFLNWTVTNIVKGWASGTYPNFGFLIKLDNESLSSYKGGTFPSKEYGEEYGEVAAPKLEIIYTVPTRGLTIEVEGSGTTSPALGSHMYSAGTVVSVDAIPDAGWMLDHWLLDGVVFGPDDPFPVTMDVDHTLRAVFVEIPPPQYELNIEVEGSGTTIPALGVHTYDEGSAVSVDAQPDAGWMLDHWLLDGVDVGDVDPYEVTMDGNHVLRAVFSETPPVAVVVESCGPAGDQNDLFDLGEAVYVTGSGYSSSTTYNFSIVVDEETWSDGMAIPERVPDTATTISSNIDGDIPPTAVWSDPQTIGEYDVVVDVNGNGQYDAGTDVLDDNDIEVTGGFSVIPEFPSSLILLLFVIATLLSVIIYRRK